MKKYFFTVFVFSLLSFSFANEKSDTFQIFVHDTFYKVLGPMEWQTELTAIIENKTLVNIRGKYQTGAGKVIEHVSVDPGKFQTVKLKISKEDKLYFVPLSPPFQEVILEIGKPSYEIPPKK